MKRGVCCLFFFYMGGEITYFCLFLNFLLGSGTVPSVLLLKQNSCWLFLGGNFLCVVPARWCYSVLLKSINISPTIHLISAEQQTRIKTSFCKIGVFVLDRFFNVLWRWTGVGKLMP